METTSSRPRRHLTTRVAPAKRGPVDVLETQLGLVKLARLAGEWTVLVRERDRALDLLLGDRVDDEVRRFRRVLAACTGWQDDGEEVRARIRKRLTDAFMDALGRGDGPRELLVNMQRIPRATAHELLVADLRAESAAVIAFLTAHDERVVSAAELACVAASLTREQWSRIAAALLTIDPLEPLKDVTARACMLMRTVPAADR